MSMYNWLYLSMKCPKCGRNISLKAEFRFGFLNLDTYGLEDTLRWTDEHGNGLRYPKNRPENGNYSDKAYAECPVCQKDFWLKVEVVSDIIKSVDYDSSIAGYIHY